MREETGTSVHGQVLDPPGDLAFGTELEFQQRLDRLSIEDSRDIIVDLSKVNYMSSSCISSLLRTKNRLSSDGRQVMIRGCSRRLFSVFQAVKMDRLIDIER